MKIKGLADRIRHSWYQDISLERLIRAAYRYKRALRIASKAKGQKESREAVREVERKMERLLDEVFDLPGGLLARTKGKWSG